MHCLMQECGVAFYFLLIGDRLDLFNRIGSGDVVDWILSESFTSDVWIFTPTATRLHLLTVTHDVGPGSLRV